MTTPIDTAALRERALAVIGDPGADPVAVRMARHMLALLAEIEQLREAVKPAKAAQVYPADFEAAWSAYPTRAGANKKTAFKAWSARRKAGAVVADLLSGTERYAKFVLREGTEERFIKQPATFFGPDEHYMLPWTPTRKTAPERTGKFDPVAHINRNIPPKDWDDGLVDINPRR